MTLEDFKKILSSVPIYVRIDFSGMAEPWANPQATTMLEHALGRGHTVAVYTTLFGMEDPDRVLGLLASYKEKVATVCLHLPDDGGNMRGWSRSDIYITALNKFLEAGASGSINRLEAMTMDAAGKVHKDLSLVNLNQRWVGQTRAGALDTRGLEGKAVEATPRHEAPVTCRSTPFYDHNVVLPNGDVLVCCMDYGMKHSLGNLISMSYDQVFSSGQKWKIICVNSKPGFSEESICKLCSNVYAFRLANAHWDRVG